MVEHETERRGDAILLALTFGRELEREDVDQMARLVEEAMDRVSDLRLVLDLSATTNFDPAAFVSPSGTLVSFKSIGPVSRYAVIGAPDVAEAAIETFGKLLPLESRTFPAGDRVRAKAWAWDTQASA